MTTGRDDTTRAALSSGFGAGPQRLQAMATEALERIGAVPWCDPFLLALGFRGLIRAVTRAEERASLDGPCIDYLWVADDERETKLNILIGSALAVFEDNAISNPSPANVARLAGYLALSVPNVPPETELTLHTHLPAWFLREHQKRRRWDKWSASGIFAAVSR